MKRAVVVGSGVGGLTAAVLLAREGVDVTVCERHTRAGGLLQRFFRQGVPYDTGFHYCGGVAPDDVLGAALRHLGVFDELKMLPLDPDGFDRLQFPDLRFDVPVGPDRYRERLKQTFPHEAAGLDRFCDRLADAVSAYGLYTFRPGMEVERLLALEGVSLSEVIAESVRDPLARGVLAGQNTLYGVPSHEAPFGLHALVLHHFLRGAHRIEGGGDRLAMRLVSRLRAMGGRIRFRAEVTGIAVEDRAVTGVELASGERIEADTVVYNAHPRLLLGLLPLGAVRPAYAKRVAATRTGHSWFGAYLELDGPAPELGNRNLYRHLTPDADGAFRDPVGEQLPFYYATAPGEAPGQGRPHPVLLMLMPAHWHEVAPWAESRLGARPEAYAAWKERRTEQALQAIYQDFPELRGRVRRVEASSPLTATAYTGALDGAMYGHYHAIDQMGRYRPSQHTRVNGLALVGQSVFSPGVLGSMMSAYYAMGSLLGLERLVEELKAQA